MATLWEQTSSLDTTLDRLRKSSEGFRDRIVQGRITGFSYAPLAKTRNVSSSVGMEPYTILAAPANTPEELHARGIARLLTGDLAGAVDDLAVLRLDQPNNAVAWSDYAAAVMEKASRDDNTELMIEAFTAADHACDLRPRIPAALFNRAMALESVGLKTVARRAFQQYVAVDSSSGWAEEARHHLATRKRTAADQWETIRAVLEGESDDAVIAAIVRRFPQEARTWGEGEYLARWATSIEQQDQLAADHWLLVAQRIGTALTKASGESLLRDASSAAAAVPLQLRSRLAKAHLHYRQARILYGQRRVTDSAPLFEVAAREFADARSPMADVVAYYLANVAYDRSDAAGALDRLKDIDQRTPEKYPALKAEIQWTRASALARANRLYESSEAAQAALVLFERLGESDNITSVRSSLAGTLSHLGRDFEAWRLRRTVFQSASESGHAYVLELAIASAARNALRGRRSDIARALLSAQLDVPGDSARVRFDALLWHAFTVAAEEHRAFTLEEEKRLGQASLAIADIGLRRDALDEARLAKAIALRPHNASRALALLDASLAERVGRKRLLDVPRILLERARALRALGRPRDASAALEQATTLIEKQHDAIQQPDLRDSYLGSSDGAFTDLADLLFESGDVAGGFGALERARGRAITERLALGQLPSQIRVDSVAQRIPAGTTLLEWLIMDGKAWVVMVRRDGLKLAALPVGMKEIERHVKQLRNAIESNDEARSREEGEVLHSLLFGAEMPKFELDGLLVLVRDPVLELVPFAALRNRATGHFLIEEHEIVSVPSAGAYLLAIECTVPSRAEGLKVVLAGDPVIAPSQFASLRRLPAAASEIRAIAAMYPGAIARTGLAATRQWFIEDCPTSDIIHIAAHAVLNDDEPWLSVLPLAADAVGDGLLYVRDIAAMRLWRSPIVVLAGCQTAASNGRHIALHNLSLAFLAAGARSVAGTLWNVDDRAARMYSITMQAKLSRGKRPADAHRQTQLAMIHSPDASVRSLKSWSSFELYGSEK